MCATVSLFYNAVSTSVYVIFMLWYDRFMDGLMDVLYSVLSILSLCILQYILHCADKCPHNMIKSRYFDGVGTIFPVPTRGNSIL